jgi:hypothetical protein
MHKCIIKMSCRYEWDNDIDSLKNKMNNLCTYVKYINEMLDIPTTHYINIPVYDNMHYEAIAMKLCKMLKELTEQQKRTILKNKEINSWWINHQEEDRIRQENERKEHEHRYLYNKALEKLTKYEMEVLHISPIVPKIDHVRSEIYSIVVLEKEEQERLFDEDYEQQVKKKQRIMIHNDVLTRLTDDEKKILNL